MGMGRHLFTIFAGVKRGWHDGCRATHSHRPHPTSIFNSCLLLKWAILSSSRRHSRSGRSVSHLHPHCMGAAFPFLVSYALHTHTSYVPYSGPIRHVEFDVRREGHLEGSEVLFHYIFVLFCPEVGRWWASVHRRHPATSRKPFFSGVQAPYARAWAGLRELDGLNDKRQEKPRHQLTAKTRRPVKRVLRRFRCRGKNADGVGE